MRGKQGKKRQPGTKKNHHKVFLKRKEQDKFESRTKVQNVEIKKAKLH